MNDSDPRPGGPEGAPGGGERRREPGDGPRERRRPTWQEFRRAYPGIIATMAFALLAIVAIDAWLIARRVRYANEVERLRAGMTDAERRQADAVLAAQSNRFQVMLELIRRQARVDKKLHLSIEVDSGRMVLERESALLREMPVEVGPERTVGTAPDTVPLAVPRGTRTVERVIRGGESWEVPRWVYSDRGLPVPSNRSLRGALGEVAVLLSGGTVIYSMPTVGPLNDSTYVLPGSVRARLEDLKAIAPNLEAGMSVYFY